MRVRGRRMSQGLESERKRAHSRFEHSISTGFSIKTYKRNMILLSSLLVLTQYLLFCL